ncbi:MAG: hypothetical protein JRI87_04000 [Deltaproteobacteria bacterium]|nr:hypothetical protein [Deltaproteobacteria bacterium]
MKKTIIIVKTNPVEGKEKEYNDWYSNVHLKEVLAIKGFRSAQRFKLTNAQQFDDQPFKYMAIYEIDNEDVEGTIQRLNETSNTMSMEPVIDFSSLQVSVFESIGDVIL